MIVDTHTHVVAPDEKRYPLSPRPLSGEWYRKAPASAEQLLAEMDAHGVARAVLVQGVGAYSFDNRYAADSAEARPERFASACCVDVDAEDPVATLTYWIRERGMRGVRLFALARPPERGWLDDPRTYPLWERAGELGAHVIVTILSHQLPALQAALERFPGIAVSLDHCGFPPLAGAPWNEAAALFELASNPNLYLKVTTHVIDAASRNAGDARSFVRALVEAFGAERLMWGSDYCQTHDRSYGELVALGRHACSDLSEDERTWCLGGTARRLWPSLR